MRFTLLQVVRRSFSALLRNVSKNGTASVPRTQLVVNTISAQKHSIVKSNFLWWNNLLSSFYNNGVLNDIRRKACNNFLKQRSAKLSLLSFVMFTLGENHVEKKNKIIPSCQQIYKNEFVKSLKVQTLVEHLPTKSSDYDYGKRLGKQTCNGAVYAAKYNSKEYAVKIMFNLFESSDSAYIYKKFKKEYDYLCPTQSDNKDYAVQHPNIMPIYKVFVDETPLLPDSNNYVTCLPLKYHKDGLGRNKTMFMVMPKYECNLSEYLSHHLLTFDQRFCLLLQLTNSVACLEKCNIVHRDIKCDNILLDCSNGSIYPRLVLSDFGECYSNDEGSMMCYQKNDIGGNVCNMSPEVKESCFSDDNAMVINYSKADAWSCGKLALEIFQIVDFDNKISNYGDARSSDYFVHKVISGLLNENPNLRISAYEASVMLFMIRFAPDILHSETLVLGSVVERWLLELSINLFHQSLQSEEEESYNHNLKLATIFLSKADKEDVHNAVSFLTRSL